MEFKGSSACKDSLRLTVGLSVGLARQSKTFEGINYGRLRHSTAK